MLVPTATVGLFGVTWPQNAHPVLLKATRTERRLLAHVVCRRDGTDRLRKAAEFRQ